MGMRSTTGRWLAAFRLTTPVLRYSEEPDHTSNSEESGSSEYLRTGVG
jgi:hypothetical protein